MIHHCGGILKGAPPCSEDSFFVVCALGFVCDVSPSCATGLFDFHGKYTDGTGGVILSISKRATALWLIWFDYDADHSHG